MDQSYGRNWSATPPAPDAIRVGARIVSFLHGGGRMAVLTGAGGAAILDLVLDGMPGRVLRVRNQMPGELDVDGIVGQIGEIGPAADDAPKGGPALVRCLMERAHGAGPAVLAIEDAHTLAPAALLALAQVPGLGGPDLPGAILLLAGDERLPGMLAAPGLERLRDKQATLHITVPGATNAAPRAQTSVPGAVLPEHAPVLHAPVPHAQVRPRHQRRWAACGAAVVLLALAALAWPDSAAVPSRAAEQAVSAPALAPALPASVPPAAADTQSAAAPASVKAEDAPALPAAQATAPAPTPAPAPLAEPAPQQAAAAPDAGTSPDGQLRQEFDAFLNRAGQDTAKLPASARNELLREYVAWRAQNGIARTAGHAP